MTVGGGHSVKILDTAAFVKYLDIMNPRLRDAHAKLDWAKAHVNELRSQIVAVWDYEREPLPIRREFDPSDSTIVFCHPESITKASNPWELLIGDAIHSFRCALDYLWWQLATDHLGREPTEKEAPSVQFPIVSDQSKWPSRFLRCVDTKVATEVEDFQPFKATKPNEVHPLGVLATLSNIDKHRKIHVFTGGLRETIFQAPAPDAYIDCRPLTETGGTEVVFLEPTSPSRKPEEIFRVRVIQTGPNPDLQAEPKITGFIGVGADWDVLPLMNAIGDWTGDILEAFDRFLK